MTRILAAIVLCMIYSRVLLANDNWPQWRGPFLNGTSDSTNLPLEWSESKHIRWKVRLPSWSGSTPIVWGDRIWVMSPSAAGPGDEAPALQGAAKKKRREGKKILLFCLSKRDGSRLWHYQLAGDNAHYGKQNMSSPSPVSDGKYVWALTGTGILTALDMKGHLQWRRDIQKDYGKFGLLWGYASSPLLLKDKLVLEVLHGMNTDDSSYLIAFDLGTGKTIWKVDRPTDAMDESPDAYTTATLLRFNGRTEVVINGGDYLTGHDPGTGKELWRCGGINPSKSTVFRTVCSPLAFGGMVYGASRRGPLVACKAGGRGLVTDTHLAWTSEFAPDVPTPVSDGKYLYVLHDQGYFTCLDAMSGRVHYSKQRLPRGTYSASPLLADGRIYVTNESACTAVVAAGAEFKILSENKLDSGYTLSSIAVAGGEFFIRTSTHLYCISEGVK
ncbi:MAG: outer membrane protein assembly factor BamB family protein [Planctomycetota bacterium]|jgi:outer membrane protein assembly factor BamB